MITANRLPTSDFDSRIASSANGTVWMVTTMIAPPVVNASVSACDLEANRLAKSLSVPCPIGSTTPRLWSIW
jgi:diphthamide biosynthesis methyltransferase